MAEEKKDPWLNYLALTTVILAVCATLSTFKGGGFSTRSVIAQAQASDQWAYSPMAPIPLCLLFTLHACSSTLTTSRLPPARPSPSTIRPS